MGLSYRCPPTEQNFIVHSAIITYDGFQFSIEDLGCIIISYMYSPHVVALLYYMNVLVVFGNCLVLLHFTLFILEEVVNNRLTFYRAVIGNLCRGCEGKPWD